MNIVDLMLNPFPLRTLIQRLARRFKLGTYFLRMQMGAVDWPHYCYCVYNAALLARKLGYQDVSVLEFGVAGGRGLLALEYCAEQLQEVLPVNINIYGFDTGTGLPEPIDYRDLPYHWKKGFYSMDVPRLQSRLKTSKLVLGDVRETVGTFLEEYKPHPIGAVLFDLDFYSSTAGALKLFECDENYFLPRLFCYFDDVTGSEVELYNDYTGTLLAINEFNHDHEKKKLAKAYHLLNQKVVEDWYHKIWIFHNFEHSKYNDFISDENQQRDITEK